MKDHYRKKDGKQKKKRILEITLTLNDSVSFSFEVLTILAWFSSPHDEYHFIFTFIPIILIIITITIFNVNECRHSGKKKVPISYNSFFSRKRIYVLLK